MPFQFFLWRIAFDTGWTMEYIKSLPMSDIIEYLEIKDAMNKAGVR